MLVKQKTLASRGLSFHVGGGIISNETEAEISSMICWFPGVHFSWVEVNVLPAFPDVQMGEERNDKLVAFPRKGSTFA